MFKQKISIAINSEFDRIKLFNEFEILMGNFCKTGQITGNYETSFLSGNKLISFQTSLEKNSLAKKHYDEYTVKRIANIEDWSNSKLKIKVIGNVIPEEYKVVCSCKEPKRYVLFTTAFNESGSIDCGVCNKIAPLYKLQQLNYNDRSEILSWEENYKSCDRLQLDCTVGEKWATKQMSDPASQLSKQGIKICTKIKELTGIPVYYYLYNYKHITHTKDKARLCPSCNGEWLLKERFLDFYDFRCDECNLLSTFSPVTN